MLLPISSSKDLFYANSLLEEYQAWLLEYNLKLSGFVKEINQINKFYYPEELIGLYHKGKMLGMLALKEIDSETVELKRFYLSKEYRNNGVSSYFMIKVLQLKKIKKYKKVKLQTFEFMQSTIQIYKKLGFREIPPYKEKVVEDMLFFEKEIA